MGRQPELPAGSATRTPGGTAAFGRGESGSLRQGGEAQGERGETTPHAPERRGAIGLHLTPRALYRRRGTLRRPRRLPAKILPLRLPLLFETFLVYYSRALEILHF